jgi:hypothetical protein
MTLSISLGREDKKPTALPVQHQFIIDYSVDQNPIRIEMAVPFVLISSFQGMIMVIVGQTAAFRKLLNSGKQLLNILPPFSSPFHIPFELR